MLFIGLFFIIRGLRTACCDSNNPSQAQNYQYYAPHDDRYYRGNRYSSGQASKQQFSLS